MTEEGTLYKHGYRRAADIWWFRENRIGDTRLAVRHCCLRIAEVNVAKRLLESEGYIVYDPGDWPSHRLDRIDAIIKQGDSNE